MLVLLQRYDFEERNVGNIGYMLFPKGNKYLAQFVI